MKIMSTQHTPGPWTAYLHEPEKGHDFAAHIEGRDSNHPEDVTMIRTVAVVLNYANITENEANARLISVAPDLLEGCKQAMIVISQHYPAGANCCDDSIQIIRAAIAQAEGRKA